MRKREWVVRGKHRKRKRTKKETYRGIKSERKGGKE